MVSDTTDQTGHSTTMNALSDQTVTQVVVVITFIKIK